VTTGTGIRAIAFDLMDTVVRDPFRDALEAATGLALDELLARRDPDVYPAFERGEIDEDAYWGHYERAGIDVDPQRFHEVRRAGTRWLPGMAALLEELDGVVLRVTASNYSRWVEQLADEVLGDRFDRVIASCHLGVRKPDERFYRAMLDRLRLSPAQVAFVDDRRVNVEGALAVGMEARRFVDAVDLRGWLVELGVL
jgi:FMN hydrolase / 5-amino-6-(5-phospho-D-ribitylamino)uracil phosphatase